jgi:hypothetical protein
VLVLVIAIDNGTPAAASVRLRAPPKTTGKTRRAADPGTSLSGIQHSASSIQHSRLTALVLLALSVGHLRRK